MEHSNANSVNVTTVQPTMATQGSHERRWAGHCGCDGSCEFQHFNDDMQLVDSRTPQTPQEQQLPPDEGSPPLLLHLLMMW
ncbi:uncharacterized protein IUM83_01931 [Phytophthora cinnamomi]|uniref:uncharacterized protein n=1 Tax=Phytophthora cinnamomi TaxID=4785 RepID=UPI003559BC59|nr:hypothetical protein IUM83_01931 [Phytophthora cinnamomi]